MAKPQQPVAAGLVRLAAPADLAGLSIAGIVYPVANGVVDVPAAAVPIACGAFGCEAADPGTDADA